MRIFAAVQAPGAAAEVQQGSDIWAKVRRGWVGGLVAAALMISGGLSWASAQAQSDIDAMLNDRPAVGTQEAQELANILDGQDWERKYIALLLEAQRGDKNWLLLYKSWNSEITGEKQWKQP